MLDLSGPPAGWTLTIEDAPAVREHIDAMRQRAATAARELDATAAELATLSEEYERQAADAVLTGNPVPKKPARLDSLEKTVREKSKTVALLAERLEQTTAGAAGALFRCLGDVERELEKKARERMPDAAGDLEGALRHFAFTHSKAEALDLLSPKGRALFDLNDLPDGGGMLHGAYCIRLGRSMAGAPSEALGRLCVTCENAVKILADLETQGKPFAVPEAVQ